MMLKLVQQCALPAITASLLLALSGLIIMLGNGTEGREKALPPPPYLLSFSLSVNLSQRFSSSDFR